MAAKTPKPSGNNRPLAEWHQQRWTQLRDLNLDNKLDQSDLLLAILAQLQQIEQALRGPDAVKQLSAGLADEVMETLGMSAKKKTPRKRRSAAELNALLAEKRS